MKSVLFSVERWLSGKTYDLGERFIGARNNLQRSTPGPRKYKKGEM